MCRARFGAVARRRLWVEVKGQSRRSGRWQDIDVHGEHQNSRTERLEPERPRRADPAPFRCPHVNRPREERLNQRCAADTTQELRDDEDHGAEGRDGADEEHAWGGGKIRQLDASGRGRESVPRETAGLKRPPETRKKTKTQTMREKPKPKEV